MPTMAPTMPPTIPVPANASPLQIALVKAMNFLYDPTDYSSAMSLAQPLAWTSKLSGAALAKAPGGRRATTLIQRAIKENTPKATRLLGWEAADNPAAFREAVRLRDLASTLENAIYQRTGGLFDRESAMGRAMRKRYGKSMNVRSAMQSAIEWALKAKTLERGAGGGF